MARNDRTDSVSEHSIENPQGPSTEDLLGRKPLPEKNEPGILIRIESGNIDEAMAEVTEMKVYRPKYPPSQIPPPVVIGPFSSAKVETLIRARILKPLDLMIRMKDRWQPLRTFYAEFFKSSTVTADVTRTDTYLDEFSITDTGTAETQTKTQVESEPEISGEGFGGDGVDLSIDLTPNPLESRNAAIQEETTPIPEAPQKPNQPDEPVLRKATPMSAAAKGAASSFTPTKSLWLWGVLGAVLVFGFFRLRTPSVEPALQNPTASTTPDSNSKVAKFTAYDVAWPEELRPRDEALLDSDSDVLVKKIRPVLNAYESGVNVLSKDDEALLLRYSQVGTSSWEARRLAANQLAVFWLGARRIAEARKLLEPIYEAAPSDPVTLINLSLIHFVEGNLPTAQQLAETALRLSPQNIKWTVHSLLGMIAGADSSQSVAQLDNNFQEALEVSANNPFIYGLWLQSSKKPEIEAKKKSKLLSSALWADPNRLVDSPLRAPLGAGVLLAEAREGLKRAAEAESSSLSKGQLAFVRWLDARSSMNPVGAGTEELVGMLSGEESNQSQFLYAFALVANKQHFEASELMTRLEPLLDADASLSSEVSLPWSYAGDAYLYQGDTEKSISAYQRALAKNKDDVLALHGLALAYRAKADYVASKQKFDEALAIDPSFVPAILRIHRFDWQRSRSP